MLSIPASLGLRVARQFGSLQVKRWLRAQGHEHSARVAVPGSRESFQSLRTVYLDTDSLCLHLLNQRSGMSQPLDLCEEGAALTERDKDFLSSLRVRFWKVFRWPRNLLGSLAFDGWSAGS